jgi:transcriptional regulator with XRE-family HTH domain
MKKTLVEEYVEAPVHMRLFQQERAIYEVTELLEDAMRQLGITRSELAAKLGKSKGWVTQLLDGEGNKTIRTIADAFAVLGLEYRSFYKLIQIATSAAPRATTRNGGEQENTATPATSVIKLHGIEGFRKETRSTAQTLPEMNDARVTL